MNLCAFSNFSSLISLFLLRRCFLRYFLRRAALYSLVLLTWLIQMAVGLLWTSSLFYTGFMVDCSSSFMTWLRMTMDDCDNWGITSNTTICSVGSVKRVAMFQLSIIMLSTVVQIYFYRLNSQNNWQTKSLKFSSHECINNVIMKLILLTLVITLMQSFRQRKMDLVVVCILMADIKQTLPRSPSWR